MISRSDRWTFVFSTLVFVLVVAVSLPVAAETLVVARTGAQFSSIQAAIDSADPGDTVQVREGTYKENLSVDKDLTLKGVGPSKVKIDGQKEGYPVLYVGPSEVEVTVKDLTLQGSEGAWVSCEEYEKGLCPDGLAAVGDSELSVKGATISGNAKAGLWLRNSAQATVKNSEIKENKTGILLRNSAQATVDNSEITGNRDIGIGLDGSAQVTVYNSDIKDNGDGIGVGGSAQATVKNSEITGNGHGIALLSSAQVTVQNNSIRENNAGIEIYEPEKFEGTLEGSGNQIKDNVTDFKEVSESTREELVS